MRPNCLIIKMHPLFLEKSEKRLHLPAIIPFINVKNLSISINQPINITKLHVVPTDLRRIASRKYQ